MTVYARVIYNRNKADLSTGMKCAKTEWDAKNERFKKSDSMNQTLNGLKEKIYRAKIHLDDRGLPFDAKDITWQVNSNETKGVRLVDFYEEHIERKLDEPVTYNTIQKYTQTLKYVKGFIRKKRKGSSFLQHVNLPWVVQFDDYLKRIDINEYGDKMQLSTKNKHHVRLKAVLNDAIHRGHLARNPYSQFKLSFPSAKREYLTRKELGMLMDLDLSKNRTLDRVRDLFLFTCYTGLRFQDAQDLTINNLHNIEGEIFLRFDQGKTDERREIPLLKPALDIIDKYNYSKERLKDGKILPKYTNQKTNFYLKHIAQMAGITKPLTHHIARHTCATTVLLDNGVPLETVSHWLGHRSIRTTQIYAKTSHRNLMKVKGMLDEVL